MIITVLDASNYFRGLLLLVRKDLKTTNSEIELLQRVGANLGFEKEFCDSAIREILENEHIVDVPPSFSSTDLALKFVKDGLRIASSDSELHPSELQWLWSTAERNGLDPASIQQELASLVTDPGGRNRLDAEDLEVRF